MNESLAERRRLYNYTIYEQTGKTVEETTKIDKILPQWFLLHEEQQSSISAVSSIFGGGVS